MSYGHSTPSVVRPSSSVRPSVVVRLSVNFHIFNFSRTAWWILKKLGRDEILMVPYKCCCFSARSAQGRIQGGAKIGNGGPLLQETSSSDRKATATNQMHSNDLEACGKKCCYFLFLSEVFYAFIVLRWATVALWASCFNWQSTLIDLESSPIELESLFIASESFPIQWESSQIQ